jgi:protein-S-isoprenylcysteine O-methyltransferase Ste14
MFVLVYEEPALERQFGQSYVVYKANVRRWWPRLRPVVRPHS